MPYGRIGLRALVLAAALAVVTGEAAANPWGPPASSVGFGSRLEICTPPVQPVALVSPTVITDCTQAGIQSALDGGGHIAFDCGPDPITIPLISQLLLNHEVDTVIDGGGLVTLDGQQQTRILYKGWHNPGLGDVLVTIQNLRFINAKAPAGGSTGDHSGGAINVGHPGTRLHVIDSTFEGNATSSVTTADNQGGAIFVSNAYETILSGCRFESNSAGNGGAFGGIATGLLVYNSVFCGNDALDATTAPGIVRGYGGAVHLDGVTNSYNPDSLKRVDICGSVFEDNAAIRGGGATVVTVSDNKGTLVTYERSSFVSNEVTGINGSYGQGGAIYHIEDDHAGGTEEHNLEILASTFHDNRAGKQGGAAWLYVLGRGEVVNSTFHANTTTAPFNEVGQGGAMVITLGRIDIANTTFAYNHAAYQAGALHGGGSGNPNRVVTLHNTIFLSNTLNLGQTLPSETKWQGYHTNRPMADGGSNIQFPRYKPFPPYDNEVNNPITADPIYVDPLLGPLADNGGPTLTLALLDGSPAIDAGTPPCPATDQRGVDRANPQGFAGACDIGAYEAVSRLVAKPASQAIRPGQAATVTLLVVSGTPGEFDLDATSPDPAHLVFSLSSATLLPGETSVLTVTDGHTPPVEPGIWYTIPITATHGGLVLSAEVQLLVGGDRLFLPLVVR